MLKSFICKKYVLKYIENNFINKLILMDTIKIEISSEYRETMDFLKQVLAGKNGEIIKEDNELVEIMITWFMSMIEQEMWWEDEHVHDENCHHNHD